MFVASGTGSEEGDGVGCGIFCGAGVEDCAGDSEDFGCCASCGTRMGCVGDEAAVRVGAATVAGAVCVERVCFFCCWRVFFCAGRRVRVVTCALVPVSKNKTASETPKKITSKKSVRSLPSVVFIETTFNEEDGKEAQEKRTQGKGR